MALNVERKHGHNVSTELETLMYVLIFIVSGGILPWRNMHADMLVLVKFAIMSNPDFFSERVLTRVPRVCEDVLKRMRKLFFTPDCHTDVSCAAFINELHL